LNLGPPDYESVHCPIFICYDIVFVS